MEITFKVQGHTQVASNLRILADKLEDLRPFFKDALEIIKSRTDEIFGNEGRNIQQDPIWAPLAPSTIKARQNRWGYYRRAPSRAGIMRWTGNMQESTKIQIGASKGTIAWTAKQAPYHQEGGGNLPRRVIVNVSSKTATEVVRALQRS